MCKVTTFSFSRLILFSAVALFVTEASAQEQCTFPPDKVWDKHQTPDQLVVLGFDYPYERSQESYLFVNGMPYPYERTKREVSDLMTTARIRTGNDNDKDEDRYQTVTSFMTRLGLSPAGMADRTAVIGYGGNSAPSALIRKFVNVKYNHVAVFPVVKSSIRGFDVVYSPHLVFNGAMPATLAPSASDTRVDVYITWLDPDQLKRMHESEAVGLMYSYGKLAVPVELDPDLGLGQLDEGAFIYIDCYGALTLNKGDHKALLAIKKVHAEKREFTAFDQLGATNKIIELVKSTSDAKAFMCQNVQDRQNRKQNTEKLRHFRVLFKHDKYKEEPGKTCPKSLESLLGVEHIWELEP